MPCNCDQTLGGSLTTAHCAGCHQTFGSVKLFDDHQVVDYDLPVPVACQDPRSLGLAEAPNGVWRTPEALLASTQRVARMRSGRLARTGVAA